MRCAVFWEVEVKDLDKSSECISRVSLWIQKSRNWDWVCFVWSHHCLPRARAL